MYSSNKLSVVAFQYEPENNNVNNTWIFKARVIDDVLSLGCDFCGKIVGIDPGKNFERSYRAGTGSAIFFLKVPAHGVVFFLVNFITKLINENTEISQFIQISFS